MCQHHLWTYAHTCVTPLKEGRKKGMVANIGTITKPRKLVFGAGLFEINSTPSIYARM